MEKGRSRLSVTADAYGLTNSGVRRSLASRPPYRTSGFGISIASNIESGRFLGQQPRLPTMSLGNRVARKAHSLRLPKPMAHDSAGKCPFNSSENPHSGGNP